MEKLRLNASVGLLHSHTTASDGMVSPTELVSAAAEFEQSAGRRIILAVTDHDTMNGLAEAQRAGEHFGIPIIPGEEITSRGHKHILALNLDRPIPNGLSAETTLERIREQNGLAIIAHPLLTIVSPGSLGYFDILRLVKNGFQFDGIEIHSQGRSKKSRDLREINHQFDGKLGAELGGNDSHFGAYDLARSFTSFVGSSVEDLIDAIRNKTTHAHNGPSGAVPKKIWISQQWKSNVKLNIRRYVTHDLI